MSIQGEIDRINQNVADTYSVLSEKGATMPETQNSDELADTARTVSTGLAPLIGTTETVSPAQVKQAIDEGRPIALTKEVCIDFLSITATCTFNNWVYQNLSDQVLSNLIIDTGALGAGSFSLLISGNVSSGIWAGDAVIRFPSKTSDLENDSDFLVSSDTGWVDLTLASGATAGSQDNAVAPRGRVKNGVLYLNGNLKGITGKAAGFVCVATLPAALKTAVADEGDIPTISRFAITYDRYYVVPGAITKSSSGDYLLYIGSQRYGHSHTVSGESTDTGTYNGIYNATKEFSFANSICLG